MKINGKEVVGDKFAYDSCHKIYICEDVEDEEMMRGYGYLIHDIKYVKQAWEHSCELRFISNAKLTRKYVEQFEQATFGE